MLQGTGERGILALVAVLMTEVGDDIVVEVVAWRWSMLSWLDFWNVIELFMVVLSMGVALGCMCATKMKRTRVIPVVPEKPATVPLRPATVPLRCEFCTDSVNPKIFPYKHCSFCGASPSYHHGRCCPLKREVSKRTMGAQSQCTYKRKVQKPHFHVLPEEGSGVFADSFYDYINESF